MWYFCHLIPSSQGHIESPLFFHCISHKRYYRLLHYFLLGDQLISPSLVVPYPCYNSIIMTIIHAKIIYTDLWWTFCNSVTANFEWSSTIINWSFWKWRKYYTSLMGSFFSPQDAERFVVTHGQPWYHLFPATTPKCCPERKNFNINSNKCLPSSLAAECQQCEGSVVLSWQH